MDALSGDQRLRAILAVCLRQLKYLTPAKPHQPRRLGNPDPAICQIVQYAHPVDLSPAHRNHRHRPNTPQLKLWRVTSLSGPTVTSLSGVYTRDSHKTYYGISKNQYFRAFRSLYIKEIEPEADNSIYAAKVIPS
jgi:hypothetical protein